MVVNKKITRKSDSPRKKQIEKFIKKGTAKKKFNESYDQDSSGREIKSSASSKVELFEKYYVCHEQLVIPTYLIHCVIKLD